MLRATLEGLRQTTAEIVAFLDADDVWAPQKVERIVEAFERDPSLMMVSHDYRTVAEDGRVLREDDPLLEPTKAVSQRGDPDALSAFMRTSVLEYRGNVWLGSAYSIRRSSLNLEAFEVWVGALPEPGLVYQDHPLATFLLVHGSGRVGYVDAKLFSYRLHDGNYSSAAIDRQRARAIVGKGLATRQATHALVERAGPAFAGAAGVQAKKLREYVFLDALYGKNHRLAMREFAACASTAWSTRQTFKEFLRLASVVFVGPERFLAVKRRAVDVIRWRMPRFGKANHSPRP